MNKIHSFIHCRTCLQEIPHGESPESYARLSIGATVDAIQVWCVRHDHHVATFKLAEPITPVCDACASGKAHFH